MILHSLSATFGCLNNAELELDEGLNVIRAPNESGKSTWLAFLRTMLYGFPARERGALADKNRYAPWNGAAMKGRIDLNADGEELVLIRDTVRSNAPMGRFFAAHAGTSNQIDGMTGQNAGELLTGVPRAVFERSAFVSQSALTIDQDAELEKRIAALISSGEENTSYSETEKILRNAMNQRRHNKTGILPRTEEEIAAAQAKLEALNALHSQSERDRADLEETTRRLREAEEKLTLHARMDAIEAKRALFAARAEQSDVQQQAEALRKTIEDEQIPPAEHLMRIKFNAANLLTTQVSMNHVQTQAEEAAKATAEAQKAVDASIFAPAEPETAAEKVRTDTERYQTLMTHAAPGTGLIVFLTLLTAAAAFGGAYCFSLFDRPPLLAALGAAVAAVPVILALVRRSSRKRSRAEAAALLAPYGVSTPEEIEPLLIYYNKVYSALMAQKETEAQVNASWQNFFQTCKKLSEEILEETGSFCPNITNVHEVSPLLEAGLRKWKQLSTLTQRAAQLEERCRALREQVTDDAPLSEEENTLTRPAESREALEELRRALDGQQAVLRSRIDRAAGEMAATGERIELSAQLETLESRRAQVQEEYDAIALAREALAEANENLQNRFSPALGQRAGEIFSALTGGKYHRVLLNEAMQAAAETADNLPREAALLSQGASDQLYLAVRLAICDLVLPAEKRVPLILDDSLINFDEERMALALDYLAKEAEKRQILLFTCQNREAVYLQNRENVHIISLSAHRWH